MKRGYVVSDLHIFCPRSTFDARREEIYRAAAKADLFVFNGDTFDFPWTSLGDARETAVEAVKWLRRLAKDFPKCHFQVVLGNHDCAQDFVDNLAAFARRKANLSWHPYYVRFGPSVFLHGDAAKRNMSVEALADFRARRREAEKRGQALNWLYNAVVSSGVHRASSVAWPKNRTARRLSRYLEEMAPHAGGQIKDVYFGHTHRAFCGHRWNGVAFHNTGSLIKGMKFNMLPFAVRDDDYRGAL